MPLIVPALVGQQRGGRQLGAAAVATAGARGPGCEPQGMWIGRRAKELHAEQAVAVGQPFSFVLRFEMSCAAGHTWGVLLPRAAAASATVGPLPSQAACCEWSRCSGASSCANVACLSAVPLHASHIYIYVLEAGWQ